ncbi:hypothetical protein AB0F81_50040, partial [Actinoplanes sp. NPDC024001]
MLTDVDLPAPGLLWTRWATLSATLTGIGHAGLWSIDDHGAHHADPDGNWARFALLDGRRAVLYGHHGEHSATAQADPPLDLLTGAPDWLPWDDLGPLAEAGRLGFVIWHESGRWSRVRYQGALDDGMAPMLDPLLSAENTLAALTAVVTGPGRYELTSPAQREQVRAASERLLHAAVRADVGAGHLEDLLGRLTGPVLDTGAALAVAARAGIMPGNRA